MKKYRVAVLGCRARGTSIATAYNEHPRTEVVGLCDLRPDRAAELGEKIGVTARFPDLDEMIRTVEPDIVVIATGTEYHYDLAMRVLEHGVNIDVEKPMCVDLQQADAMLAKGAEKNARIAVHHQGRTGGAMRACWKAYKEGKIGRVRYILGSGKGYYGGYGLMNIGTHMINNIIKFGGRCRSVSATALAAGRLIEPIDVICSANGMGIIAGEYITAILQFDDCITANLLQHRFPRVNSRGYYLEIYGTEGRLFWRGPWLLPVPHFVPGSENDRWEPLESIVPDTYRPESGVSEDEFSYVDEYVRALDENRDHECSGAEALHVVEIMMGVFESAAYRCMTPLPQEDREHPLVRWRRENGLGPAPAGPRAYGEWLAAEDQRLGRA